MNTGLKNDLSDATDCMESLAKRFAKLTLAEKIDLGARIKAIAKHCKDMDEAIKDEVKAKRKGKEGYVNGELFKAYLSLVPSSRLDQQKLKVEYPEIHAKCLKEGHDQRITFEPR